MKHPETPDGRYFVVRGRLFTEDSLRQAGCVQMYPGPAALLACFGDSPLAK